MSRWVAFLLACLAAASPLGDVAPIQADAAPACRFVLGFQALHDLIPSIVGGCLDDERHNPDNGDASQHTTGGLLVWRHSDNWTAFTDGYRTWINGPNGLQERLNAARFGWEPNPTHLPIADAAGHTIKVLPCAAIFAVSGQTVPEPPSSLLVQDIAPDLAAQLAFYSDGWISLLAPSGWYCTATIGADGNQTVTATPRPEHASFATNPPFDTAVRAVVPAVCQGCVYELVCGLYPEAGGADNAAFADLPCSSVPPAQEQVTGISGTVLAFEDPPHIVGSGDPSGGPNPANGVVLFSPIAQRGQMEGSKETCTLPDAQHATCTAVLNDFISRYPISP